MGEDEATQADDDGNRTDDGATRTGDGATTGDSESRRRFLRALGATSAIAGTGLATAQETTEEADGEAGTTEQTTTTERTTTTPDGAIPVVLGGRVSDWLGLAPSPIAGEENPTLQLRAGERYRLVWINLDGERHRWQGVDSDGNVLQRTDAARRVGATRSVTFEATDEMARYRCEFHPEEMQGSVDLGEGFETTEATETTTDEDGTTTEGDETATGSGEVVDVAVGPEDNTLRFVPEEVEISVGDAVRWTAKSSGHNVSAKPEADPKVQLPEGAEPFATYEGNRSFAIMQVGETFEHTFTVPGTYVYVCVPHASEGMVGRVIVSE